jgi:alkylation response protein AidB-like acyl-CoA dehydrogenase
MDFNFTAEQDMLRDSVSRYLADRYDLPQRQATLRSGVGWRPDVWRGFAHDLGVLGAPFSEAEGGLGGGPVETLVIMEEFGKALVIEPFIDTVVLGGSLLRRWGSERAGELIAAVINGDARFAFACLEPGTRFNPLDVGVGAQSVSGAWRIHGTKDVVIGAPFATHFLVTARTAGERRDRKGLSLFLVARDAPGVSLRVYPTVDGSRAADVRFDAAAGELIGEAGEALEILEPALDDAVVALCAEAVGVMRRLLADTVEYARQRKQFDAPIAANQVLQHRMVDMHIALEHAVSMTYMATLKLDRPPAERMRAVSSAKAFVGKSARFIGQAAVQIHGGMGMTNELAISHYFKRATVIESQLGSTDYHLARIEQCDRPV